MERLTVDEIIEHCKRKTEKYEYLNGTNKLENSDISLNFIKEYWEHKQVKEYLEELKIYRNLEKQGLLLRLPVAPNTTVYEVCNNADACNECEYFEKGYCCDDYCGNTDVRDEDGETYLSFPQFADKPICEKHYLMVQPVKMTLKMIVRNMDNFGKTVFLTQAEAEQKLKEMESK